MHPSRPAGEAFGADIISRCEVGVETLNEMMSRTFAQSKVSSVDGVRWLMCQRRAEPPILAAGRPGGLVRAW